ncbi:MAG: hypothetical protein JO112_11770 [Planctomycetes bacterium]|nr:hypothetical protein [Planctomycetota bacterium]
MEVPWVGEGKEEVEPFLDRSQEQQGACPGSERMREKVPGDERKRKRVKEVEEIILNRRAVGQEEKTGLERTFSRWRGMATGGTEP